VEGAWFFKLFEFGVISVAIGGVLIWQIWDVNKSIAEDKKRASEQRKDDPPAA
jgi:hypothetical protein